MESLQAWGWLIVLVTLPFVLVPAVFYILTLQRALQAIDPPLRPVAPGLAWLFLIPVFNLVWIFFLVVHLRNGYAQMHQAGRLTAATDAGYTIGIAMGTSWVLCLVPWVDTVASIPAIALWILHWMKVSQARSLVQPSSGPLPSAARLDHPARAS